MARAYQIKEELREVLRAPDRSAMKAGLDRILRRTNRHSIRPLRRLHDTPMSGTTRSLPWPSTAPLLGESKRSTTTGRRWSEGPADTETTHTSYASCAS
ncbi:MAG: hypothetical protein IPF92_07625 [Myxococcales bacterium]|nr:hypothetical protein [Myxococcales bacterium]